MAKNSMNISNAAIDRIHAATKATELDSVKELIELLTGNSNWKDIEPDGRYRNSIIELNTGIVIKWNEFIEGSKNPQNGRLVCKIVGEYLRSLSLQKQLIIPLLLARYYSISQLDIKFQLNNPIWPIAGIQEIAYQAGLSKWPEIDYKGKDSYISYDSGNKIDNHRSRSVLLKSDKHDKDLIVIYDPLYKHGIENAQHWERRLRGKYIAPILKKLEPIRKDAEKSSELIVQLVLDSVEFTWNGKAMPWFKQIKELPIII